MFYSYVSKHLDLMLYKTDDRPLLDLFYSKGLYYKRGKRDTSKFPYRYPFTGIKNSYIYIELVIFRVVIHLNIEYNIKDIGPDKAKEEFNEMRRSNETSKKTTIF